MVDAGRCLAWLLQKPGIVPARWREPLGDRIYGCDDCQEVCPPTVRLRLRRHASCRDDRRSSRGCRCSSLLDASDDASCSRRQGRWYIADRDPRWLRRNALVVLGNVGAAATMPHVRRCLARYLADRRSDAARARRLGGASAAASTRLLPADDDRSASVAEELRGHCVKHLLVTNDFPPKIGGIQS